jgi:hypothetical protein
MRSEISARNPYSLSIVQKGDTVEATLTSASGDLSCTFPNAFADNSGFTTFGRPGYYNSREPFRALRCGDGTVHDLISMGQDIAGKFSGTQITGVWNAFWAGVGARDDDVDMKAQFTGSK